MFHTIKSIHFVGIGGSGMSGIAEVLANLGYQVSGSDQAASATTERLRKIGIRIDFGHEAQHVHGAQVGVASSAILAHNPEIQEAVKLKIPLVHRSEMLAELMRLKYGIVVAGTHGKTTTTSILAWSLFSAGLDPTVVIGGKLNALGTSAQLGQGEFFVAEGDESDGSFLKLSPTIAVLTNIDRDHLDHYKTLEAISAAFESFLDKVPFYGGVCACIDDPLVQRILPRVRRRLVTYGLSQDADISAKNIQYDGLSTRFTPVIRGKSLSPTTLKMSGAYNVSNALATLGVGDLLNLPIEPLAQAIGEFEGVQTRFSCLAQIGPHLIVDDYAHNPTKIHTILKGTSESFAHKNIIVVFQPHRYSRVLHQQDEFARAFGLASGGVIVLPIYAAGEQPVARIDAPSLAHLIQKHSFPGKEGSVYYEEDFPQAAERTLSLVKRHASYSPEGCVVLCLGAGDIRKFGPLLKEKWESNYDV